VLNVICVPIQTIFQPCKKCLQFPQKEQQKLTQPSHLPNGLRDLERSRHQSCLPVNRCKAKPHVRNSFLKEQKNFKHYFEDKPQCNFKEKINNDSKKFLHKLKEKPHCLNPLPMEQ
jgi:hypothetical protein